MISISICLSDLPKEKITTSAKNSKKYINLIVADKRETDPYGNDTTVYVSQTKEEREGVSKTIYVGQGKKIGAKPQTQSAPIQQPAQQHIPDPTDDLPF